MNSLYLSKSLCLPIVKDKPIGYLSGKQGSIEVRVAPCMLDGIPQTTGPYKGDPGHNGLADDATQAHVRLPCTARRTNRSKARQEATGAPVCLHAHA